MPSMKNMFHDHVPPARTKRSASPSRRVAIRISAKARSAVASVSTPGVLVHDDAAGRAGGDVDVVVADRDVRDDAQLRPGRVEQGVVDAVVQERHERVGPASGGVRARRWRAGGRAARPRARRALREELERRLGDRAGDDDARGHQPLSTGAVAEQLADRRERLLEVVERVRVREAQVALAVGAEGRAGEHGDTGLVEQPVGELARVRGRCR